MVFMFPISGHRTTESTICTLCVHKRKKKKKIWPDRFQIHHTSDILICAVLILRCCLLPSDFQSMCSGILLAILLMAMPGQYSVFRFSSGGACCLYGLSNGSCTSCYACGD